ncbi:hypothetical protein H2204_006741 [Knufia peltigerae]|uniref:Carboxypeptidase n=1 Tax=Knufia peltigerae TaxID=1002370 RepID=A0AA38Y3B1_9EURO|nr:hypothetical protein H2204_006741 [Knufia peltigerae]
MKSCFSAFITALLLNSAPATSIPTKGKPVTVNSPLDPNVSLSYKETNICETTAGVRSWTGYVNLPLDPAEGRDYPTHTFFWFFESRKDPRNAPLSVWLQGGPGSPSIPAAIGENGPCSVTENSVDTILNPWSWTNEVNMLYIDQPVSVGFSYDTLVNGTINEFSSPFNVTAHGNTALNALETNSSVLAGTFSAQDSLSTPNTTVAAARVAWHFMQIWMKEFPALTPKGHRFSMWGESFGGHWVPTFANFFLSQNQLLKDGKLDRSAIPLQLDTIGLVNACVDIVTQMPFYPEMAFNNTYGPVINRTVYEAAVASWPRCWNLIEECRAIAQEQDPMRYGNNTDVNKACAGAYATCFGTVWTDMTKYGRDTFDLTAKVPSAFPPKYAAGYLNRQPVQTALGVPLNFTGLSDPVNIGFEYTGDFVVGRNLAILGRLLDQGIKVALVYGDADYQCNWLGGEALSLAINSTIKADFHNSGYANITTKEGSVGGTVRQYGNLSFSRVFSAGHQVPYYQPETAFAIFNRTMSGVDVATGETLTTSGISTKGPQSVFDVKVPVFSHPPPQCYFWDQLETCTASQKEMIRNDTAILKDYIMVGYRNARGVATYY